MVDFNSVVVSLYNCWKQILVGVLVWLLVGVLVGVSVEVLVLCWPGRGGRQSRMLPYPGGYRT